MPRPARNIVPGIAVHLIQRGVNRGACFHTDADYLAYLSSLRILAARHRCMVHAYCLMTNHVHLLLTPSHEEGCSDLMRELGRRYVQLFNRRHERSGTLWEGRFRSCLVESAQYVLACYRYIELNPVRARMVNSPGDYRWSSHVANIGQGSDPLLTPHPEYEALGADPAARHAGYRALFEQPYGEGLLEKVRSSTNGGYPLASEGFKQKVLAPLGYRTERGKPGPKVRCAQASYVVRKVITVLTPN